jgi:isoquinoline 1-oxidoreductase beta subunit
MTELQINRRTFLKTTIIGLTGLTIGCNLDIDDPGYTDSESIHGVTIWLNISEDNRITIVVAKAEMGQGVSTALPMIVAEELEADWQNIAIELKGEIEPYAIAGFGVTAGSTSIMTLFEPLREVGAAAKEMLITACAQKWQVEPESLTAENSYVIHPTRGSISYGELAEDAGKLPVPENPTLKDPEEFTIIGKSLPRLDTPFHIEGQSVFGTDVVLPDMLYAAVRQSPIFGGEVSNFDSLTLENTRAEAIVAIPNGVAVVADSYWEAQKAARSLEIEFENPEDMEGLSSEDISEQLAQNLTDTGAQADVKGSPESELEGAPIKVNATYEVPFLAHAVMETMTCTASVTETGCEIWLPTQGPRLVQFAAAGATGLDPSSITVHPTWLGGGFGRKIETDYAVHAVLASKAVGRPVKVIWSREEDTQHDFYRPVFMAEVSGGVDENNKVVSWIGKSTGPSIFYGGSFTGEGSFGYIPYDIPNMSTGSVAFDTRVPIGFWRSINSSQNTFFIESFMDELANAAGEDPLEFRMNHVSGNKRMVAVLEKVAEMSNWGNPGVSGASQGVAFTGHSGSIVAQVFEVSVDTGGSVTVHKVYCAIDCGDVVNPDIVKAQVEGGIIFGLTAVLYGEITIENGRVKQSNFHNYPMLTLKETPEVETEIIISGASRGGIGETPVPPVAPAVTNAIFAATGHRIRKLPISRYEFV